MTELKAAKLKFKKAEDDGDLEVELHGTVSNYVAADHTVVVRGESMVLNQGANELARFGSAAEGYDYKALSERLLAVKAARPDETRITLLVEPATTHDTLVQTMDAVRITPTDGGRTLRELFPNISLGDAPKLAVPALGSTP